MELGGGWRVSLSLRLSAPSPAQDLVGAAVLHILSLAVLPPRPLGVRLRAGSWTLELALSADGRWSAPHTFVALARPAAMPLYADVFVASAAGGAAGAAGEGKSGAAGLAGGGTAAPNAAGHAGSFALSDEVVGTARVDLGCIGGAPEICWAPVLPQGENVLKVECALLPQGGATEWHKALAAQA